jgi:hypothetical protein
MVLLSTARPATGQLAEHLTSALAGTVEVRKGHGHASAASFQAEVSSRSAAWHWRISGCAGPA